MTGVEESWAAATAALTEALADLAVGGVITVTRRGGEGPRIAVGALPDGTLRAEADGAGSDGLPWQVREAPRGDQDRLARDLVAALRSGMGAELPADVVVGAEDTTLPAGLTSMGSATTLGADTDALPLMDRVRLGVGAAIGRDPDALTLDEDGDVPVRSGSAVVFVRVMTEPPMVRVFAPIAAEVPHTPAVLERVNELNGHHLLVRAAYRDGAVVLDVPLIGEGLVPQQVGIALGVVAELADEIDDAFVAEFGGRTFLDDGTKPPPDDSGLGGYI